MSLCRLPFPMGGFMAYHSDVVKDKRATETGHRDRSGRVGTGEPGPRNGNRSAALDIVVAAGPKRG